MKASIKWAGQLPVLPRALSPLSLLLRSRPFKMLLMWTVNVWKWSFEPRPSVQLFLGGDTFSKEPVCFHIKTRSFVRLSICTMAHSQSDVGRGGGTIKTKGPDILFCLLSDLFIYLFLSWVNSQSSARSSLLWSSEKLQWILIGSVWVFVHEVHLYMWLMSTPAASLSVLYGQVLHYRCITLQAYWFFFFLSASILTIYWIGGENVLLLWKRRFNRRSGGKK